MSKLATEFFRNRTTGRLGIVSTVIRVLSGLVFVATGLLKFVYLELTASGIAILGLPAWTILAVLLGLVEFVGGLMLIAGAGTRLAAFGLAIAMIGATIANILVTPSAIPVTVLLFVFMVYLLWAGPGRFAVDSKLTAKVSSPG